MGMCLYAPSLALSAVTSLSIFASMAIMGAIVTFYTTIVSNAIKGVPLTELLVYFFLAGLWCLWILFFFSGLVAYATYSTCDPLTSGKINKPDQILPFLVTDKLGHIPALSGLFVAAVYGGVLRTEKSLYNISYCFNSLIGIGIAMLVSNVAMLALNIESVTVGSGRVGRVGSGGRVGSVGSGRVRSGRTLDGAFIGFLAALTFNVCMVVGNFVTGGGSPARLPLSVAGCASSMNATLDVLASTTLDSTTVDQTEKSLYNISYCFNSLIGIGIAMLVSNVAMLALSPNNPKEVKGGVVNPTCERLYEWAWQRYQVWRKGRTNQDTTSPESYVEAMKMLNQVKADASHASHPTTLEIPGRGAVSADNNLDKQTISLIGHHAFLAYCVIIIQLKKTLVPSHKRCQKSLHSLQGKDVQESEEKDDEEKRENEENEEDKGKEEKGEDEEGK
ncbi:Sodium-coupled monocarboxylate transporter 2 [Chionoecetes opilio]|uniref:Sodium-coupled monocarboxylate transporter 2 n=1 Tax=Chionoecetes opilio TaxID=41210 RepID=A0A8J5C9J4_CHIOP|nr:Sodium-coupled monocarboxylate transporter 2 [Chionoecetes opilio]